MSVALDSHELTLEVIGLSDDELAGSLRYTLRRAAIIHVRLYYSDSQSMSR